jgi:putative ABC transport system substrate-binding protein
MSDSMLEELRKFGWRDGQNIRVAKYYADGRQERFSDLATQIVRSAPDLIVAISPPAVLALQRQTKSVPIVFSSVGDPVGYGFIDSMARPGGNITGIANFGFAMGGKWIEILKEISPSLRRAAFLYHPGTTTSGYDAYWRSVLAGAQSLGVAMTEAPIGDEADIDRVITAFAQDANNGLVVPPDPFTIEHQARIIGIAARLRLPAVYSFAFFAANGGLVSYGVDSVEQAQRTAFFIDRILRGEKASELPAEGPTKFEMFINLKTAKALDLAVPQSLLLRADQVIE